jgi:hypothetical protein
MAVSHEGMSLSGTLEFFDIRASGPISGEIHADGKVSLAGLLRDDEHGFETTLTRTDLRLNSATSIGGRIEVTNRFTNAFGPQVLDEVYEIVSLRRQ